MQRNKIFIGILAIFVVYFLAKHTTLFFVKNTIEKEFTKITGLELQLGRISYSLLTFSGSASHIVLKDNDRPLFSLQKAKLNLSLLPLLSQKIKIQSITVKRPQVMLYKKGEYFNYAKLIAPMQETSSPRPRKTASQKKEAFVFPFKIEINKIRVKDFMLSYVEKFKSEEFNYAITQGNLTVTHLGYPHMENAQVELSMLFPQKTKATFQGTASFTAQKDLKFNGALNMKNLDLSRFKIFMLEHYGIALDSGSSTVTSEISLRNTKFFTKNKVSVSNLDFTSGGSIGGTVLTQLTKPLLAAQKITDQKTMNFEFTMNGDIADKNLNYIDLMGNAVASGFYKQISNTGEDVLKQIEDLLPSF
ncbi:MAG: hypothetical protein A3B70_08545 [Deltaproteobacteria bacterium RIFCSPHIGHO2_02_FULL_40_11]|nr:MAG: hypothetical protein A3B70_08545 [Deltaproteobacteria bacterium RIFCSPHIGHO2_02_FULL_40_11]